MVGSATRRKAAEEKRAKKHGLGSKSREGRTGRGPQFFYGGSKERGQGHCEKGTGEGMDLGVAKGGMTRLKKTAAVDFQTGGGPST